MEANLPLVTGDNDFNTFPGLHPLVLVPSPPSPPAAPTSAPTTGAPAAGTP